MIKRTVQTFALLIFFFIYSSVIGADRATEIKEEMWNSSDKDFKVVQIPQKWADKSAVIIAQLNRFEYKKALMLATLRANKYNHYRLKLIDKNAINKYSEMTYAVEEAGLKVYAGFKVIKPSGKEIIVDLATAVKMEREAKNDKAAYNKIAIPNLEPGDILDYYICTERNMPLVSEIYFFEPVIHNLPQEYPIIRQKLQFRAQRKCYINLRSLNGAPSLKLVEDEANDETYYSLEDGDRDGIANIKWIYPNRELPSVKFRATYASGKGMRHFNVLLGEQGEVKSSVTAQELADLTASLTKPEYITKDFSKYIKKNYKGVKDPVEIAKGGYYYYRNIILQEAEDNTLDGTGIGRFPDVKFTDVFSTFLKSRKIPHDIVVTVPRNISSIEEVLLEQELEYLVRVKSGSQYVYFSPMSIFSVAGEIPSTLEGVDAYALDGLTSPSRWKPSKITLPVTSADKNVTETEITLKTTDFASSAISARRSLKGVNKTYAQYEFLDVYDAIEEDNKKFKPLESFNNYIGSTRKKYVALKQAYMDKRAKSELDQLKESLEGEYDFKIKDVTNFKKEQTGRTESAPAMVYSFDFTTEDLIKKTGLNYLVDIGKLMEKQTQIEGDELNRNYNIYFDFARTFSYRIVFEIPKGYQVQGLDKFNQKVETKAGGFTSTAKEEAGKVIIETRKHYDANFASKSQWKEIVSFLNAAHSFTEQKILLKKK
jgi:hypothetical protein